jgi:hypothetical protein
MHGQGIEVTHGGIGLLMDILAPDDGFYRHFSSPKRFE